MEIHQKAKRRMTLLTKRKNFAHNEIDMIDAEIASLLIRQQGT